MQTIAYTSLLIAFFLVLLELSHARASKYEYDIDSDLGGGIYKSSKNPMQKYNIVLLWLMGASLVFVSTYRHGFIDTWDYILQYKEVHNNFEYILSNSSLEKGWLYLLHALSQVSEQPRLLFFTCAVVINFAYLRQLSKYSTDVAFALFLYFTQTYLGTNNGMRQYFAAAILLLAFGWIIHNNYIKFIVLAILLSLIHKSTLICIPIFFIVRGRKFNAGIIGFMGFALMMLVMPGSVFNILVRLLGDSSYTDFLMKPTGSMGIMRLVVEAVPCVLSLMYYYCLKEREEEISIVNQILTNFTFINFALMIMSLKMVFFARISMYYSAYIILVIPLVIGSIFNDKERFIIKAFAIILYAIYFYFQLRAYGVYLRPFYLDFS